MTKTVTLSPCLASSSSQNLGLPLAAAELFIEARLPRSVDPFLGKEMAASQTSSGFREVAFGARISMSISWLRSMGQQTLATWLKRKHRNGLCISDHDDGFDETLINGPPCRTFAGCKIVFRELAVATKAANGDDAFRDNDIPPPLLLTG